MKNLIVNTSKELKSMTSLSFGNKNFRFHTSQVKSINGIDIKTYLEVTNKHVSHYVGGGSDEFFKAPFNVILK